MSIGHIAVSLGVILVFIISLYSLPAPPLPHHKTPTLNTSTLESYIFQQYVHCLSTLIPKQYDNSREFPLFWSQGLLFENSSFLRRGQGRPIRRWEKQLFQFFSWVTTQPCNVCILNRNECEVPDFPVVQFCPQSSEKGSSRAVAKVTAGDANPTKGRRISKEETR